MAIKHAIHLDDRGGLSPDARVLVTGATGKIGGGTARILADSGVTVRMYVRDPDKAAQLRNAGADVVLGRLEDQDAFARACQDVDTVLLVPPDADPASADHAIDPALASGIRRVVRITAQGATTDAPSQLFRTHAAGERKLEDSGLEFHHLRCNTFFQNIHFFFDWIADNDTIFACRGEMPVSWIDARDIAAAAAAVIIEGRGAKTAHDLNGPEALTSFDLARRLSDHLGRAITCTSFEAEAFVETATRHGWPSDIAAEWAAMFSDDYWGSGFGGGSDDDLRSLIGAEPKRLADYLQKCDFGSTACLAI